MAPDGPTRTYVHRRVPFPGLDLTESGRIRRFGFEVAESHSRGRRFDSSQVHPRDHRTRHTASRRLSSRGAVLLLGALPLRVVRRRRARASRERQSFPRGTWSGRDSPSSHVASAPLRDGFTGERASARLPDPLGADAIRRARRVGRAHGAAVSTTRPTPVTMSMPRRGAGAGGFKIVRSEDRG